ncbi:MAG: hypothetical protein IJU76_15285 [Desulfovibrionaceae bacterium]|nr:hypothetical protein [Desulfovibrionaceae bacterium]
MKKDSETPKSPPNVWEKAARDGWKAILAKVRSLRDSGKTYDQIGEIVGVSGPLVKGWLEGAKKAENSSLAKFLSYLDRLGLDYRQYFPEQKDQPIARTTNVNSQDQHKINVYCVAGAGLPIDLLEEKPIATVYVPAKLFRKCDFALQVEGDSMAPGIPDKSICGIQCDVPFVSNLVYLAYLPHEGHVIKRIRFDHEKKTFIFHSDNPDQRLYYEYSVPTDSSEKIILGKVVWVLKTY